MKVRVYTDYDPIRILNSDSDENALKAGITGAYTVVEKEDLPVRDKNRNKWRVVNGKVKIDHSIELPHEKSARLKASSKQKLKNGQTLSDEELDEIIK